MLLKSRFDDHLVRKTYHFISGTLVALLFAYYVSRLTAIKIASAVAIIVLPLDFLRLQIPTLNNWCLEHLGFLMRDIERKRPSAQVFYILGLLWCLCVLPRPIAIQSILMLAWLDPIAAIYGVRFGRRTWSQFFSRYFYDQRRVPRIWGAKTLEGSAAGFLVAVLAGIFAWTGPWAAFPRASGGLAWPHPSQILCVSVVGALTAVIAEVWPTQWDDNVNIPFWGGISIVITAWLLSLPF